MNDTENMESNIQIEKCMQDRNRMQVKTNRLQEKANRWRWGIPYCLFDLSFVIPGCRKL